tara:strand:- start:4060 stop:4362 length:303 start_codon:yes stop_codon:yes gene_type:complete
MISELTYIFLFLIALLSAFVAFTRGVNSLIAGLFSAILFALFALFSDGVMVSNGTEFVIFSYPSFKVLGMIAGIIMVMGVLYELLVISETGELIKENIKL